MTENEAAQALAPKIDIPEGAIFNNAITACSYIDADGESKYCVTRSGSSTFLQNLGLLEAAKAAIIQENHDRNT